MASVRLTLHTNFTQASADLNKGGAAIKGTTDKLAEMVKTLNTSKLDDFINRTKRMGIAVRSTSGPIAGLISQQKMLRSRIQSYIKEGLDPMDERLKAIRDRYIAVTTVINRNKAATIAAKKAQKDAAAATRAENKALEEKEATLKRLAYSSVRYLRMGLIAVTGSAALFTAGIIRAAASIEDAQAAFRPMLGSLEKAVHLVKMINETAATTPFQFDALADSAKQLLPAVNGSMSEVIKTIRMLGDTASGNAQRLDSVTRAYTKSMLRGRVDMRSMNMIAKAGVPIYTELAKSMGVNVNELFKMSRQGKITSANLTAAFQSMTSKGGIFFEGMKIASKTLTGRISTLRDNIKFLAANLGDVLLPYAKEFVEISLDIVSSLRTITSDSKASKAILEGLAFAFGLVTISLGALTIAALSASGAMGTLAIGMGAVSAAMFANPIGLVVLAIASLVGSVIWLYRNWDFAINRMEYTATFIAEHVGKEFEKMKLSIQQTPIALQLMWSKVAAWIYDSAAAIYHEWLKLQQKMAPTNFLKNFYTKAMGEHGRQRKALKAQYGKEQKDLEDALNKKEKTYKANIKLIGAAATALRTQLDKDLGGLNKPGDAPKDNKPKVVASTIGEILEKSAESKKLTEARFQSGVIKDTKAHLTDLMETYRVFGDARVDYLKGELARIKDIEELSNEAKVAAAIAVEDMITEITASAVAKRAKDAEKEYKAKEKIWQDEQNRIENRAIEINKANAKKEKKRAEIAAKAVEAAKKLADRNAKAKLKAQDDENKAQLKYEYIFEQNMLKLQKEGYALKAELDQKYSEDQERLWSGLINGLTDHLSWGMQRLGTFVNATTSMIVNAAQTGKFAFKDMINSIATDLLRMQTNKIMTNMFTSLFSSAVPSFSGVGASLPEMPGGAIALSQYAKGGVFDRPTIGVFGEAGPEAVVPLVRKNGVLGIASSGGNTSGGDMIVNINNTSGADVDVQESKGEDGARIFDVMVTKSMNNALSNGSVDKSMNQFYGINRKGRRR